MSPALLLRALFAFLMAVLASASLASILQTQFNLARIAELGAPVPLMLRLDTTLHDLAGFMPLWAAISAAGLLIAFPVAALAVRWSGGYRLPLFTLAAAVATFATLRLMALMLPITAIAATRSALGVAALVLAGAVAGAVYVWLKPIRSAAAG